MSASSRAFPAWSVPPAHGAGEGAPAALETQGQAVATLAVSASWLGTLARALRASAGALRARPVEDLVEVLGGAGARFLDPQDPLRARALELLPATSGLSPQMAAAVLDGMAADWTPERLRAGLRRDFADPSVLDGFAGPTGARLRAVGPELCVQVASGSVPGVGATALLRSLLVKAPTLLKPGRGDVVLPVLLADAIREADPALGASVAVVYWPGGEEGVEDAALAHAGTVAAYGGDEAVAALRSRTPVHVPFVAYHHRVSVGVVGRAALTTKERGRLASAVAGAVGFFDQRGCVSPQLLYVEEGGDTSPAGFAREVAAALESMEEHLPGGVLAGEEASALHQLRGTAELLAVGGGGLAMWHGGRASWTVVFDPGGELGMSCVGRVVRIRPVPSVEEVPALLAPLGTHLQTVAVGGVDGAALTSLAEGLAGVGASRITAFDATPFPPPGWHHDGQGALAALVRWVDLDL